MYKRSKLYLQITILHFGVLSRLKSVTGGLAPSATAKYFNKVQSRFQSITFVGI